MTDPKQEIYNILYADLENESVLDVGCGTSEAMPIVGEYYGIDWLFNWDWYEYPIEEHSYDVIIANDLFPNVDQRLELFLEKYLPHCKEMRLSLTYFDEPKWYRAKRVDGDEVLTMLQWTRAQIYHVLPRLVVKAKVFDGTFPNGRRVLLAWLKGGLA